MDLPIVPALIGGLAGGLGVTAFALFVPRKSCPKCNAVLPRFRIPKSWSQAIHGGCNCPGCNIRLTRTGKVWSG